MISTLLLFLAAADIAPSPYVTPSKFTSELVCAVQDNIRFQAKAWEPWMCLRVHRAFTKAAEATNQNVLTLFAIAINESDLRPGVERVAEPAAPKFIVHNGKTLPFYETFIGSVRDGGLMGVRCRIGDDLRCSNGILKGWKWPQVLIPENNVMLGAKILASKRSLQHYNGGTRDHGYQDRIEAIKGALVGLEVETKGKRMKKLVSQIQKGVLNLASSNDNTPILPTPGS